MSDNLQFHTHHFKAFPTLYSERLTLREMLRSDAASIVEISVYDGKRATSQAEALRVLEAINQDMLKGETVHWGICLKGQDEVVGTCGFYRGFPNNIGEVGYILKEAYRGKGIMTEALQLVIDFGFKEMKLKNIVAYTEPTNHSSVKVLKQLDFEQVPSENDHLKFRK